MKKVILVLSFVVSGAWSLSAQTAATAQENCYHEYYAAFRDRGAKAVPDGEIKVVVSVRKENDCTCFMGKIKVVAGKPTNSLLIEREDGTFQRFEFVPHPKYQKSETKFTNYIMNGMSPTYLSSNDEMINLFFIDYLNPVPAKYKVAPAVPVK
jgi:hypothetical protein